ncbi:uncharacterized protein K460DRAFT_329265 [Cucurbitaria berberidis CBS 394.84]|uniref:Uncharacterized protein n=1 Tax=Cucurbitaria berberidis CBS 394.84 TaxID=1168544 RepID=A0A9P4GTZ9_9PLEO|nr:uncharacterized protein K460DRAFT_329265 [Cucurbitaria berberidis CBS 394.84]KAF1851335.1 hypothetical protein K460DRAFT_329265 [Cucurbitaria berberidis CBS 394.84]
MAPTCSRAGLRLLTSVLVASSIANAAALPHQVLDPRTPLAQDETAPSPPAESSITPAGDDPENVFEELADILNSHTGYQFLRDLIERLFGLRSEEEDPDSTTTTTVYVTPTPVEATISATITPTTSTDDVMSILPMYPLTTAINVTLPDPAFSTVSLGEPSSSISEVLPPFPFNSTSFGPTPTAVSITDSFTAILPGTVLDSSSSNATTPISTTRIQLTSVLIVTATVVPSPFPGTGNPVSEAATPLWPNATVVTPSPAGSGTGAVSLSAETAISNATVTQTPLYPNTTLVIPIVVTIPGGPATALNVSLPVSILPTPISETGSSESAAVVSVSGTPLYSNTTYVTPTTLAGTGTTAISAGTISNAPIVNTATPLFPNVTTTTSTTTTTIGASILPSLVPSQNQTSSNDTIVEFPGLLALRRLCQDPQIRVISLPLLNRFYGPNAYPSLFPFPGCLPPNNRQAIQAPGLLNCTALGTEVQRCQASGRKVLLSVKADGLDAVGGNANFGDPLSASDPFGPYFVDDAVEDSDDSEGSDKRKRQISLNVTVIIPPFPLFNLTAPVSAESALVPSGSVSAESTPVPSAYGAYPVFVPAPSTTAVSSPVDEPVLQPYPTHSNPLEPVPPFPNLFDEAHPPSAFALTLFSLFGEGHTERADLRPLGPEVDSPSSPSPLNGTDWITPPTTDVPTLARPLGEEVVVDGFDIQVPVQWKGGYQDQAFRALVIRLRELTRAAWRESGGVEGGPGDLGADGRGVVYFGWVGQLLKSRKAKVLSEGWVEWDGQSL